MARQTALNYSFQALTFCDIKNEKLMRSPKRKGTVPSLPMSTPSKESSTSPPLRTLLRGEVGSMRRTSTPRCLGCEEKERNGGGREVGGG